MLVAVFGQTQPRTRSLDWTHDFGDWLDQVTERADRGDRHSQLMLELMTAEPNVLQDLTSMPMRPPTLRRVCQSGRNPGWRVGHPYIQIGVAQSEISRIEQRHDMLLSTLTSYLSAAGEHPRVVVTVNGKDVGLALTTLTGAL